MKKKTVNIGGVPFSRVFCASGTRNNYGEGYWFHWVWKLLLLPFFWLWFNNWKDTTLITKTTVFPPNGGNMKLNRQHQPKEWFPRCIHVNFWRSVVVNAVALSGPGLVALLEGITRFIFHFRWQNLEENFFISYMPKAKDLDGMIKETEQFARTLARRKHEFKARIGIHLNISCPNTKRTPEMVTTLVGGTRQLVGILKKHLNCPVIVKVNLLTPIDVLIALQYYIDGVDIPNTTPMFKQPLYGKIEWPRYFADLTSPLIKRGFEQDGGFSGPDMTVPTAAYIRSLRKAGFWKPIIAGSLYKERDVDLMADNGASAFSIGAVAITRYYRIPSIKRRGFEVKCKEYGKPKYCDPDAYDPEAHAITDFPPDYFSKP